MAVTVLDYKKGSVAHIKATVDGLKDGLQSKMTAAMYENGIPVPGDEPTKEENGFLFKVVLSCYTI